MEKNRYDNFATTFLNRNHLVSAHINENIQPLANQLVVTNISIAGHTPGGGVEEAAQGVVVRPRRLDRRAATHLDVGFWKVTRGFHQRLCDHRITIRKVGGSETYSLRDVSADRPEPEPKPVYR